MFDPSSEPSGAVLDDRGTRAVQVAASDEHTCVVLEDMSLTCFGHGERIGVNYMVSQESNVVLKRLGATVRCERFPECASKLELPPWFDGVFVLNGSTRAFPRLRGWMARGALLINTFVTAEGSVSELEPARDISSVQQSRLSPFASLQLEPSDAEKQGAVAKRLVAPSALRTVGGSLIEVEGPWFAWIARTGGNATEVSVGGIPAYSCRFADLSRLVCEAPAGLGSSVAVSASFDGDAGAAPASSVGPAGSRE